MAFAWHAGGSGGGSSGTGCPCTWQGALPTAPLRLFLLPLRGSSGRRGSGVKQCYSHASSCLLTPSGWFLQANTFFQVLPGSTEGTLVRAATSHSQKSGTKRCSRRVTAAPARGEAALREDLALKQLPREDGWSWVSRTVRPGYHCPCQKPEAEAGFLGATPAGINTPAGQTALQRKGLLPAGVTASLPEVISLANAVRKLLV